VRIALAGVLVCALSEIGRAGPPDPATEARLLSADPDAPLSSLGWRGALRGGFGARLMLVEDDWAHGFWLSLSGHVELYNTSPFNFVPYQYWRGRVALEPGYRRTLFRARVPAVWSVSLPIEHESDHPTVDASSSVGFVNLNSIAARGDLSLALRGNYLTMGLMTRLHFLTCTADPFVCGNAGGGGGSRAFEAVADVVFDGEIRPWTRWRYFAAIYASWLVGHQLAATEVRVVIDTGFWIRTQHRGLVRLYATLLAGNEVGYARATDRGITWGGAVRWGF
jgi:hypothetical protein